MADTNAATTDLKQYRGRQGAIGAGDGADDRWRALHSSFGGNASQAGEYLGYTSGEQVRRKWAGLGLACTGASKRVFHGGLPEQPPPADTPDRRLADDLLRHLTKCADEQHTVVGLADSFDTSPRRIEVALDSLRSKGFSLQVSDSADDGLRRARLSRRSPGMPRDIWRPGWGEKEMRFGYLSDTHTGNICACHEELDAAYSKFESEGVTDVLHSGDLDDGPGNKGFPGHSQEVEWDCQTADQLAVYVQKNYPHREGVTTHFISSSKSHTGWELRATGRNLGSMIANGWEEEYLGPMGETQYIKHDGRDDMVWRGWDSATLVCGPEEKTRIQLVHPDGGTAYALSYQPQKWAESLEGGTKPDIALLGHYHKLNWIRERNIQVLTGECMCWQTPFMARKRIAAHVGFFIIEITVDADGTVRSFLPREFPFFFGEKRTFVLSDKAAA